MKFRLFYQGPLQSNGDPQHKHDIRRVVHQQLAELIKRPALMYFKNLVDQSRAPLPVTSIGQAKFIPLISEPLEHTASLHITLLGQGDPTIVNTPGGDIDNRLKTLFDALRVPHQGNELPSGVSSHNQTFYCLLEDDKLISNLEVTADKILIPGPRDDVVLVIEVTPESSFSQVGGPFLHNQ